jgi:hypothetical protein
VDTYIEQLINGGLSNSEQLLFFGVVIGAGFGFLALAVGIKIFLKIKYPPKYRGL